MKLPERFDTYPEAQKNDFLRFGKIKEDGVLTCRNPSGRMWTGFLHRSTAGSTAGLI